MVTAFSLLILDYNYFRPTIKLDSLNPSAAFRLVGFWILVGFVYNIWIYLSLSSRHGLAFFNGYIMEFVLSIDNLFFFQAVFRLYHTPIEQRDKALFFGIAFAAFLRLVFFIIGTEILQWTASARYVFGAIIIYSGWIVAKEDHNQSNSVSPSGSPQKLGESRMMRVLQAVIPFVPTYGKHGEFFVGFSRKNEAPDEGIELGELGRSPAKSEHGRSYRATMLTMVVLCLGLVDVLIAVDAVAAKISEFDSTFINFSSSFFAMLSLRALYFVLEYLNDCFSLLKYGLAAILWYVGVKLIFSPWIKISESASMLIILGAFVASILASLMTRGRGRIAFQALSTVEIRSDQTK